MFGKYRNYNYVTVPFLLCFIISYLRAVTKYKPTGTNIWRGNLTESFFLLYEFGGLMFGGAYTWRGSFSEFYGIRHSNEGQLTAFTLEHPLPVITSLYHRLIFLPNKAPFL